MLALLATDGTGPAVGDRVVGHPPARGWAERAVVLESVGGASLPCALRLLRRHGRLVWFGQASRAPVTLDFFSYFAQTGARIRHFHCEDSDVPLADDLATLVRLATTGRLRPELGLVAPWSDAAAALAALRERRVRGNCVLRITPPSKGAGP